MEKTIAYISKKFNVSKEDAKELFADYLRRDEERFNNWRKTAKVAHSYEPHPEERLLRFIQNKDFDFGIDTEGKLIFTHYDWVNSEEYMENVHYIEKPGQENIDKDLLNNWDKRFRKKYEDK